MSKHTPGPWHYVMRNVNELMQTFHGVRAGSFYFDIPTSNDLADANLIAAAPDLLEALEWMVEKVDSGEFHDGACMSVARAAIARARGES